MAIDLSQNPVLKQLAALRKQTDSMREANAARARVLQAKEATANQGLNPVNGPQDMQANMRRFLPDYMVPGNLGDINKVIWPFWFTAQTTDLPAAALGTQVQGKSSFTVTQEAAFILMSVTKSVFVRTDTPDEYTYIDADQTGSASYTPGLSFILVDAQSRRQFMPTPMEFDHVGYSRFPTEFPTPMLLLPNSTMEIQLFNTNPDNTYRPWLTFFGYRMRIEDAQDILSLVSR